MKKMIEKMFTVSKKYRLLDLDLLYRDIVSIRPLKDRLEYCRSLLYRIREDLSKKTMTMYQRKKLKILQKATKREIKILNEKFI